MNRVDIAIVGAGMVGAALASSLRDTGFSIALIDGQGKDQLTRAPVSLQHAGDEMHADYFEARVSALTHASVALLSSTAAWQSLRQEQILPYQKMHVWDQLGTAEINFDAAELHQDALGFIVENQSIIHALHQCIDTQENLSCFFGAELKSISALEKVASNDLGVGYQLEIEGREPILCQLLVAADGANSKIRTWANVPMREWDYQHHAIVTTVKTELMHGNTARQRFSEEGPIAFLPLQDAGSSEHFCSIVWSQKIAQAEKLMALSDEEFRAKLSAEIEGTLGKVLASSKRFSFPLRQRHAKSYVKPGLALIGDAAHTIHPLAGQGVNLGFKDVAVLSEMMHIADKNDFDANQTLLLKRYERQRQGDNLLMMSAMEGFKRLFEQSDPAIRLLRNMGLGWVDKQSFIKNQIAKHAMGL